MVPWIIKKEVKDMKRFNLFCLFASLFLLAICSVSSAQKIFTDDFEGGDPSLDKDGT